MAAFLLLLITFFLGLLIASAYQLFGLKKKLSGLPNGTMGLWPLVGETLAYLKPHNSNSIGNFLQEHCSRYGRVFKSHLFGNQTIVSCDLELNLFVLQNEEKLFQSSYPKPVCDILGKLSMMLVPGELHKKLRSFAINFINASKSRPEFLHYVDKLCVSFIDSWKRKREVHLFKETKELTFYLMLKTLLNIEPDDPLAAKILEDFLTFMKGFVSLPLHIPGTAYSKAIKARRRIYSIVKDIIKKRENMVIKAHSRGDFLDELLTKVGLSNEEKVSILMDLLLAGYETTSGLMALVVYFLSKSPSSLPRLQDEHRSLREGKKKGEPLNLEDYKKMEFTSHVINEALRCGNLVKFVHRKALKDVKFKEYLIPKGWQVLPILSAPHLDPRLHENPSEFNPWRWDLSKTNNTKGACRIYDYIARKVSNPSDPSTSRKVIPFGGGMRICPGAELGKLEAAFFIHHFVLNLRWKTNEEDFPMSCPYLEFKGGLVLEIEEIQK